jgi:hypothetical protein
MIKSRKMRWAGHEARMREDECIYGSGGKTRRKRPLGISRRRWEDIIMDLEISRV